MAILGIRRSQDGRIVMPTEVGTTMFALLSGIGGGAAQLIAGERMSGIPDNTISLRSLALPLGMAAAGAIVGAFLVPSGGM